ncbi:uncharacterized protein At4g06744-like [Silene latifolia]|uniref:uncharacterized protein At4g06744-like n=1 Tax=Silene latifolia TaxID=37657 RepID=UPI003D7840A3
MKILSKSLILLLVVVLNLNIIVSHNLNNLPFHHGSHEGGRNFWPWEHPYSCHPFWPFGCDHDQSPSSPPPPLTPTPVPVPVPVPVPRPISPPVVLPPPPPQQQPILPPVVPGTLIFIDIRLGLVYPVIQKFKSIITSDPLGITSTWVGSNICSYKGFFCDNPPYNASATTIASIDFNGYGLAAPTLDGFIDQFPDLALFHANSNNFGGIISPNIAKLPFLYELDFSNNLFTGPFPLPVVGMDTLSFLDIRFNLFTGSVPPAIFTQNLDVLFLNDNLFLSTLPDTLANTHILYLTLANNKFTGPLPRDIAKALSGLTEVLLQNNLLTGCLPYELGFLNQVTVFDISKNLLTGPLPFSLACLQNIQILDLSSNMLSGMVPDLICQLPYLSKFSLSNNYFTQVGPSCRNLIRRGVLDVSNNCIPGMPFQRSILDCTAFLVVPRICPYMETFKIVPCKPFFK